MQNNSHLSNIASLVSDCIAVGITTIVVSPGSRNAPLTILFSSVKTIDLHVVVDERSAGFYALGMAQQLRKPVAVICTSGTAALNYAPSIAEAFYLQVPLLVLTADRPLKWLHHSEGQQINQTGIYDNFSAASYTYDTEKDPAELKIISRKAFESLIASSRPVHINIPTDEPLYQLEGIYPVETQVSNWTSPEKRYTFELRDEEKEALQKNILIAVGCKMPNPDFSSIISKLSEHGNVAVISETTSNLQEGNIIRNPDLLFPSLDENEKKELKPDILITVGTHFISKHLKLFLRKYKPEEHWHSDANGFFPDTFQALTKSLKLPPEIVLGKIEAELKGENDLYSELWQNKDRIIKQGIRDFIILQPWSELQAFKSVYDAIPTGSVLHLGNSMSVRYAQYLEVRSDLEYYSNRGTSGIDGSLSTAVGAAKASEKLHVLILGDLSFMYDSNGLWQEQLPDNLRIIVLNNGGGGIFRFINGPSAFTGFERTFLAKHSRNFKHLAAQFNVPYHPVQNKAELMDALKGFYITKGIKMIEIQSNEEENTTILKTYIHKIID
ncbi:2-succinyl-5-enolpyruvyl-6-hydroxy-3-cyclohexene-1-carboxylic-acid synthase [Saccharicrinis sp. FJH54]|uniref:2-succinyl-5-enolpyruvyl-6-hydroxy-3- cyclohexene-1-carboxylic-acid synthase n=1 Tax=Saccharicrinis sp. FJH54 TaxID=3344665 RepID=UPI0035D44D4D